MEPEVTTEEVDFFVDEDEEDEWDWSKKWKLFKNTISFINHATTIRDLFSMNSFHKIWTILTTAEMKNSSWSAKNTVCTVFLYFFIYWIVQIKNVYF